MKNGDLVTQHFAHIQVGVKAYTYHMPRQVNRDDVLGVVLIRIVTEAPKYDVAQGTFKTWLNHRVRGGVIDAVRKLYGDGRYEHQKHIRPNQEDQLRLDLPSESAIQLGIPAFVDRLLGAVSVRTRHVLFLRFYMGFGIKEIAAQLGVSETRATQIVQGGLKRMRRALAAEGIQKLGDVL